MTELAFITVVIVAAFGIAAAGFGAGYAAAPRERRVVIAAPLADPPLQTPENMAETQPTRFQRNLHYWYEQATAAQRRTRELEAALSDTRALVAKKERLRARYLRLLRRERARLRELTEPRRFLAIVA